MLTRVVYSGGRNRGPKLLPSGTTAVITADGTFVAGAAGIYRVLVVGSGATGGYGTGGSSVSGGGGSGLPVYAEVELSASENVSVVIGAAASVPASGAKGTNGNTSEFGTYARSLGVAQGGEEGVSSIPGGDGWAGGGDGGANDGGTLGNDGDGVQDGGKGMGVALTEFLFSRFSGVVLSSGVGGVGIADGGTSTFAGGGAAGLLVGAAGPAGSSATTNRAGKGSGYGAGSGGSDGTSPEASNPGVVIVEGPWSA